MPIQSALATVIQFKEDTRDPATPTPAMQELANYVTNELETMKRWRDECSLKERMDRCLLQREGEYDAQTLQAISSLGGSEVYARLTTNKIRGGAAMLRAIFIQGERPWEIRPTPVPTLPTDIKADIEEIVTGEVQTLAQAGQPPDPNAIRRRIEQLTKAAQVMARKQAKEDAEEATRYIDDLLTEGKFYPSLNEFILDFCTLPFAVLKGPHAVMKTGVDYVDGTPTRVRKPVLMYGRVDPYDILWSPGSATMDNANIIERMRMTRADINSLIGLEGYDEEALRSVLREYGDRGYRYNQFYEAVREEVQNRESVIESTNIDILAYNGRMTGQQLIDFNVPQMEGSEPFDTDLDYMVQAWVCGRFVLKVQIDPDAHNRVSYYSAAFEPVAGSIAGTALPELISDIQEVYNATLRALVNNIGLASGPQVMVNTSRWRPPANGEVRVEPWKIWFYENDSVSNVAEKPVEFYQPSLNSGELMNVLSFLQNLADEISGIPRYLTGSDKLGGAGRTSSGLAMLMGNANRTMTSVAGGIDQYVIEPLLTKTYDLVMLTTGTEILRGDEEIAPRGATYAETREQDRMRQNEFLATTTNPVDLQILGIEGRAKLLRYVAKAFSNGEEIVPSDDDIRQRAQAQAQAAAAGQDPNADPNANPNAEQPRPPGQSNPGGTPKKPTPARDPRNEAARPSDNFARTRSQSAMGRQARG